MAVFSYGPDVTSGEVPLVQSHSPLRLLRSSRLLCRCNERDISNARSAARAADDRRYTRAYCECASRGSSSAERRTNTPGAPLQKSEYLIEVARESRTTRDQLREQIVSLTGDINHIRPRESSPPPTHTNSIAVAPIFFLVDTLYTSAARSKVGDWLDVALLGGAAAAAAVTAAIVVSSRIHTQMPRE